MKGIKRILLSVLCLTMFTGLVACGSPKEEVDVFKDVSVQATGEDGNGKGSVNTYSLSREKWIDDNKELYNSLEFKLNKEEKLSNGDKVKVTLSYDEELYDAAEIKFPEIEKEYKVKGLLNYIDEKTKLSKKDSKQLADEFMAKIYRSSMDKSATDNAYEFEVNGVKSKFELEGIYIKDDYIRKYGSGEVSRDKNYFLIVYKVDYEITELALAYDYREKDQLKGTFYTTYDGLNLAKRGKEFDYKLEHGGGIDGFGYIYNQMDKEGKNKEAEKMVEEQEMYIKGKLIKIGS